LLQNEAMSGSYIQVEKNGGYAILTLNRPEALNALNSDVLRELRHVVTEINQTPSIRVIVITGNGPKAFCAGADIAAMKSMDSEQAEEFARQAHKTLNLIASCDLISIAALNGYTLGGGLELALSCDLRIASDNTKLGLPEVTLGLIPGFGGTQRLSRVVGRSHALEIILSGKSIDAAEALRIGLVSRIFPADSLLKEAVALAESMLQNQSPSAQKIAKWIISSGLDMPLTAALEREITTFSELFETSETREGLTAFLEKRKPQY
jgi:enoyl-CoA hydratase